MAIGRCEAVYFAIAIAALTLWRLVRDACFTSPAGEQLIALARSKNRALAISVVSFVVAVFGFTIVSGILSRINNRRYHAAHGPLLAQHLPLLSTESLR